MISLGARPLWFVSHVIRIYISLLLSLVYCAFNKSIRFLCRKNYWKFLHKNIYPRVTNFLVEKSFLRLKVDKKVFNLIYLQLRSKEIDVSFASTKSVLRASQVKLEPRSDRLMGCSVNLLKEVKQIKLIIPDRIRKKKKNNFPRI